MGHKFKHFENKMHFSVEYATKCLIFPGFHWISYLNTLSLPALSILLTWKLLTTMNDVVFSFKIDLDF